MGKSGPKLSEAKAEKLRKGTRRSSKRIKTCRRPSTRFQKVLEIERQQGQAAQRDLKKVIVRNPLLQRAAKDLFNKMKIITTEPDQFSRERSRIAFIGLSRATGGRFCHPDRCALRLPPRESVS